MPGFRVAIIIAIGALSAAADPAFAADATERPFIWEVGARYWASAGSSAKDLYLPPELNDPRRISRLDYRRRSVGTPELFGRLDYRSGLFLKAKAGIGRADGGELVNEDFPPIVLGYSRTSHTLNDGALTYWTADLGHTVLDGRNPWLDGDARYRLGLFAGYHRNREQMSAYGCRQTVPDQPDFICVPAIGGEDIVISQSNVWDGLRVGVVGDVDLGPRTTLRAEAAWLRLSLEGRDTHHFRSPPRCTGGTCFTGPQSETGEGDGIEAEVALSYRLTERLSVGAGGRYWRIFPTTGSAELRFQSGAARTLPLRWDEERLGVFIQGSLKLD